MGRNKVFSIMTITSPPNSTDSVVTALFEALYSLASDECLHHLSHEMFLTPATSGTLIPNHVMRGNGVCIHSKMGPAVPPSSTVPEELAHPH